MKGFMAEYRLNERVPYLPKKVFEDIRSEILSLRHTSQNRWTRILSGDTLDLRFAEVRILCKHIGCTHEELADKDVSLLKIYSERILKTKEDELANRYGLKHYSKTA